MDMDRETQQLLDDEMAKGEEQLHDLVVRLSKESGISEEIIFSTFVTMYVLGRKINFASMVRAIVDYLSTVGLMDQLDWLPNSPTISDIINGDRND